MQRLTMGEIVIVVICHLRTFFGTYEQFISCFFNVLFYWQCENWGFHVVCLFFVHIRGGG